MIVEDEAKLAAMLADYLGSSGYETECIGNGLDVLPRVKEAPPALILLDLMLPGRNGLDVCREVRRLSQVPIIMVTARVEEIDRLLGLTADQKHQVELLYAEERAKHDALRLETQRRLLEVLSEEQRARLESVRPRPPHPECPQARGPRHSPGPGGGVGGVAPFEGQRASRRAPP